MGRAHEERHITALDVGLDRGGEGVGPHREVFVVVDDPVDVYQGDKTALSTSQEVKSLMTKAKSVAILDDDYRNNSFHVRAGDIATAFHAFQDAPG